MHPTRKKKEFQFLLKVMHHLSKLASVKKNLFIDSRKNLPRQMNNQQKVLEL